MNPEKIATEQQEGAAEPTGGDTIDVKSDAVSPLLGTYLLLPVLALATGILIGKPLVGYVAGAAWVGLFLSNPDFLDQPLYCRLDARWERWRRDRLQKGLPRAEVAQQERLWWVARFLRLTLMVAVGGLAAGLPLLLLGVLLDLLFKAEVVAYAGAALAFAGAVALVLVGAVALLTRTRSPEEKTLEGFINTEHASSRLKSWQSRGVLAAVLVAGGMLVALLT